MSRIDGGVQPYGLTIPASYDGKKPMRLDIWLHGTQQQLNEVHFLAQQAGPHETSQILADDYIQLEPFARMNHSYKFYAETDVFEVIAAVRKRYNIDPEAHRDPRPLDGRASGLRGASRLQNPTFFAALKPAPATSETKEYAGNRLPKEGLTPYQEAALHYVDAEDYALNAFDIPTVELRRRERRAAESVDDACARPLVKEGFQLTKESPYQVDDEGFARCCSWSARTPGTPGTRTARSNRRRSCGRRWTRRPARRRITCGSSPTPRSYNNAPLGDDRSGSTKPTSVPMSTRSEPTT